jgi:Tfp pilus assembly protein PilF
MAQADRPWALLELAAFRASRGEMEPAIGVLRRGLEIHPDDADLLAGMVTAARATGQRARALEYAERLQARFPDNPEIRMLVEELRGDSER